MRALGHADRRGQPTGDQQSGQETGHHHTDADTKAERSGLAVRQINERRVGDEGIARAIGTAVRHQVGEIAPVDEQAGIGPGHADRVQPARRPLRQRLAKARDHPDAGDAGDQQPGEDRGLPAAMGYQRLTYQWAADHHRAAGNEQRRHHPGGLAVIGGDVAHHCTRQHVPGTGTGTLDDATGDQRPDAGGERREHRADTEQHQPADQHRPSSECVGKRPHQQLAQAECHGEAGDRKLGGDVGRTELPGNPRKARHKQGGRQVTDREQQHQQRQDAGRRRPFADCSHRASPPLAPVVP